MIPRLRQRSAETELMDADDISFETFRGCLHDLARVNELSFGYRPTLGFLDVLRLSGRLAIGRPVEILDVGSGYGDLLRRIDTWAVGHMLPVRLTGLDLNRWSARAAAEATAPDRPIRWMTGDVFEHAEEADVIVSSLFAHHLGDVDVVRFLQWMEGTARIGWFVNDLHRHPVPATMFGSLARALRLHPFVCHDGPVSFRRAFTPGEWPLLLAAAGLPAGAAQVCRTVPFRLCVERIRSL